MKAPALLSGDTIAVIAPASAPRSMEVYHRGLVRLKERGYQILPLRDQITPYGYLADTDAIRLAELNEAIRRPDIKAIFSVRGGYGTPRLLPGIDYDAAKRHPKILVGYSDITALHWALYQKSGWYGLSGHLVVEWGAEEDALSPSAEALFWNLLGGKNPDQVVGPAGETLQPMRPGTAEGVLLGGNLMLITCLLGTPYCPDLTGTLLFIEDVGEKPYSVDRMLMQLRLAGHLDKLGGVLIGGFTDADVPANSLGFNEVFDHYFGNAPYPVATNLCYGHWTNKLCLPIGIQARLEVNAQGASLTYLETLTQPSKT
ncbi:MAG TPA: LD-carboxypeptidase [Rhodothermales bacterium]|nr:LD-carboxypeptidase [Rhodothermales bacterium]HRR09300.1 LD-carboxypeptidase [Rhodothermales bacterium]